MDTRILIVSIVHSSTASYSAADAAHLDTTKRALYARLSNACLALSTSPWNTLGCPRARAMMPNEPREAYICEERLLLAQAVRHRGASGAGCCPLPLDRPNAGDSPLLLYSRRRPGLRSWCGADNTHISYLQLPMSALCLPLTARLFLLVSSSLSPASLPAVLVGVPSRGRTRAGSTLQACWDWIRHNHTHRGHRSSSAPRCSSKNISVYIWVPPTLGRRTKKPLSARVGCAGNAATSNPPSSSPEVGELFLVSMGLQLLLLCGESNLCLRGTGTPRTRRHQGQRGRCGGWPWKGGGGSTERFAIAGFLLAAIHGNHCRAVGSSRARC
jgi:hypothetical protein